MAQAKIIQNFRANRVGFGSDFNDGFGGENRGQICVFSKINASNGTYNIRTHDQWSENGYAGHLYLSCVTGGQGTTRIYFLTGRFALTNLSLVTGGNRGTGEDCYLQTYNSTNNYLGLQVVMSGYTSTADIGVMWVGAATGGSGNYWMID